MKVSRSFSDEEIIAALHDGEKSHHDLVLRFIYQGNFTKVISFVQKNGGSEEQGQDIFQDAIVIFYKKVKNKEFRGSSSVSTFLYGIARNLWLQALRKGKLNEPFDENVKVGSYEINEEFGDVKISNSAVLDTLMMQIGKGCRELLVEYYYHNQSTEDIRRNLGLGSEQATRNKIYRCMQKVRDICRQNKITRGTFNFDE